MNQFLFVILLCAIIDFSNVQAKYGVIFHGLYNYHQVPAAWEEAKKQCESEGASLFYPKENSSALELKQQFYEGNEGVGGWMWVGIYREYEQFKTIDGQTTEYNWRSNEPNTLYGKENCVAVYSDGTLNDNACGNKLPFVCNIYVNATYGLYRYHSKSSTWEQAKQQCILEGGSLFYPDNNNLTTELKQQFYEGNEGIAGWMWVGIYRENQQFKTIDGEITEYNWHSNEPNNYGGKENCVAVYSDGTLNDNACYKRLPFVCKRVSSTLTKTTTSNPVPVSTESTTTYSESETTENQTSDSESQTTESQTFDSESEATESQTSDSESQTTESQTFDSESEATESQTSDSESQTTESQTSDSESQTTESQTFDSESEATESQTSDSESQTTESQTFDSESEATESQTSDSESQTTESQTSDSESQTTESQTFDSESEATESQTSDSESQTTESQTFDSESEATESQISDSESQTTESQTFDSESEATESQTSDSESQTTESLTLDSESETTESQTSDSESETTESQTPDSKSETTESQSPYLESETIESQLPYIEPETTESQSPYSGPMSTENSSPINDTVTWMATWAEIWPVTTTPNLTTTTYNKLLATENQTPSSRPVTTESSPTQNLLGNNVCKLRHGVVDTDSQSHKYFGSFVSDVLKKFPTNDKLLVIADITNVIQKHWSRIQTECDESVTIRE